MLPIMSLLRCWRMCVFIFLCARVRGFAHVRVCVCVCSFFCVRVCVDLCMRVCVHVMCVCLLCVLCCVLLCLCACVLVCFFIENLKNVSSCERDRLND